MSSRYHLVAGINAENINKFAEEFHNALYPKIFSGEEVIDLKVSKKLELDFGDGIFKYNATKAPSVNFKKTGDKGKENEIVLQINIEDVELICEYKKNEKEDEDEDENEGKPVLNKTVSVEAEAEVTLSDDGKLHFELLDADIEIEDAPVLNKLAKWLRPKLVERANKALNDKTFDLPILKFDFEKVVELPEEAGGDKTVSLNLEFETPVIRTEKHGEEDKYTLVAYTNLTELGEVELPDPEDITVSQTQISTSVSGRILNTILDDLQEQANRLTEIPEIPFEDGKFSGTINLNAHLDSIGIGFEEGNRVTADAKVSADVSGNVAWKVISFKSEDYTPDIVEKFWGKITGDDIPKVEIEESLDADFEFSTELSTSASGTISVEDEEFRFSFDDFESSSWDGDVELEAGFLSDIFTTDILGDVINILKDLFKTKITDKINEKLTEEPFKMGEIPPIKFTIEETDLVLELEDPNVATIKDRTTNWEYISIGVTPKLSKEETEA